MKFSTGIIFALLAISEAGLVQRGGWMPRKPQDCYGPGDGIIISSDKKYALHVRELGGGKHGKHDKRGYDLEKTVTVTKHAVETVTLPCTTTEEPCSSPPPDFAVVGELPDGQLEYPLNDCEPPYVFLPEPKHQNQGPFRTDKKGFYHHKAEDGMLIFTIKDSVLTDSHGRIGEIVANHQFQFDDVSQPDNLFNCGFAIVKKHHDWILALGKQTVFWECSAGTFYKLYDASIDSICKKVELEVIIVDC